ncbi:hypothetical protein ACET3Z_021384 [Daucus carota]
MEHLWEIPESETVKINVYCVVVQHPSAYGNTKSIGALMRDEHGGKVWGAMGPFNDFTEEQAIMAGIQSACIYAQEHDLKLEAFRLFNTVHSNNYVEGSTDRRISWVPEHMNDAARYMAEYGLEHFSNFVEIPGPQPIGNLQFFIDRDMGMVIANPEIELLPNMGLGEVVDGPPPQTMHCKRKHPCHFSSDLMGDMNSAFPADGYLKDLALSPPSWELNPNPWVYNQSAAVNPAFKAVEILESGSLLHYSDVFGDKNLDLEVHVANGMYAKDILHHAVLDTLGMFESKLVDRHPFIADIVRSKKHEFMPVDTVISLMGLKDGSDSTVKDDDSMQPVKKKARRAANV